jgi:agmatinase
MRFMQLPEEYSGKGSYFQVIPIAYEGAMTYGKGASKGAQAIIEASKHLAYYDEELDIEAFEKGIRTHDVIKAKDTETMIAAAKEKVKAIDGKFIVGLGGDHSVTLGLVPDDCDVLMLDAHTDFLYSWKGSQLNHACVARRLVEKHNVAILGVRSGEKEEFDAIAQDDRAYVVKAHAFSIESVKETLAQLGKKIYISIDADVFDPCVIRNTGTPEPGGLTWKEVVEILKIVFFEKKVVGVDIVEFAPQENYRTEAFILAKLAYKLMGLKLAASQSCQTP